MSKEKRNKVRTRQNLTDVITETAKDAIVAINNDGDIILWNPAAESMTGYSAKEVMGKNLHFDVLTPDRFHEAHKKAFSHFQKTGEGGAVGLTLELPLKHKDGHEVIVELSVSTMKIDGLWNALGIMRDVTEEKNLFAEIAKRQEELSESEVRFRTLFETSADAIMTLEPPTWSFTSGNKAAIKMFNCKDEDEFTSLGPWNVSPEFQPNGKTSGEMAKAVIMKAMTEGSSYFEWIHKRLDGEDFPATVLLTRIEFGERAFLQATVRDITYQKEAESKLIQSEEKSRKLLESLQAGVILVDAETHEIVEVNKKAAEMIGLPKEKIAGRICHEFICPAVEGECPITDKGQKIDKSERTLICNNPKRENCEISILKSVAQITIEEKDYLVESFIDIRDRKKAEDLKIRNVKLMQQKKEIAKSNRLKSEFLSNMSHELRTPLNSIIALSRVMLMNSTDKLDDEEANYLEVIERNGKKLLSLINAILDISKIEAGKFEVNPQLFSPGTIIEDILSNLQTLAEHNNVKLSMEVPENLPVIESDSERLFHIIQNLVSNAIKFTEDGKVTITALTDDDKMVIKVIDEGIGIDEEHLPHLFEKFKQIDGSASKRFQGTGLGLAIVSESLKLIFGSIEVESKVGEGTTFTIFLPLEWQGEKASVGFTPREIKAGDKSVLIVDDNPEIIQVLEDIFAEEGFGTIAALSGEEALLLAEKYQPYLITLDILMPGIDGWEVLQKLKNNPKTWRIPVVIVSKVKDEETAHALGAIGFVTKPIDSRCLMFEISKINELPNTIMVVDDNEFDRANITRMIENEQIHVVTVDGGLKCLEQIKIKRPDILILDLMMPDINGFEVIHRLREDPATINIPIIVVTAKDLTSADKREINGNVSLVLHKDGQMQYDLAEKIREILQQLERQEKTVSARKKTDKKPIKSKGTTILIIEDNPNNMITIKAILHKRYEILEAVDGKIGLELANESPDLILLDIQLPKMDGYEVLRKLKRKKKLANVPIIALTAMAMKGDEEKMMSAGFDGYMSKPIDPINLLEEIAKRVGEN